MAWSIGHKYRTEDESTRDLHYHTLHQNVVTLYNLDECCLLRSKFDLVIAQTDVWYGSSKLFTIYTNQWTTPGNGDGNSKVWGGRKTDGSSTKYPDRWNSYSDWRWSFWNGFADQSPGQGGRVVNHSGRFTIW